MSKFVKTLVATSAIFSSAAIANADDASVDVSKYEGTYAGTFWCNFGEMGMTLSLEDAGVSDDKDMAEAGFRSVNGVLNFFPTLANPDMPDGAFKVSGWIHADSKYVNEMELQPGDWIDQPENFGASPMEGRLINGVITGKPTVDGCHKLMMTKLDG